MTEQPRASGPAPNLPKGFAPAPVSTRPVSGSAPVRSYKAEWVGNDRDIVLPDRELSFVDIDMTAWTIGFLEAVDALFAPAMVEATAALDPDRAASLAEHRRRLADVIAATLLPVLVVPGEAPALDPARACFHEALLGGLASAYAGVAGDSDPLRACPVPPAISDESTVAVPAPVSIAEALSWSYALTIATPLAAQDRLLLTVTPNQEPMLPVERLAAKAAASASVMLIALPPRPAARTLFEALARASFELPQVMPHLAGILADGDAVVGRAALKRMDGLIGDVALTWPDWFADERLATADSAVPGSWRYAIDGARFPMLSVTRSAGDGAPLPPWPAIAGFAQPAENKQATGTYRPTDAVGAGAPLALRWAGLSALRVQDAHVSASVVRNANLVPPDAAHGTIVDQRFVYHTPVVAGVAAIAPALDLPFQAFPIVAAASLSVAITDALAQCLEAPVMDGIAVRDVLIGVDASYRVVLGEGDMPIDSGLPILLTRARLALSSVVDTGAVTVAAFRTALIDAVRNWHAAVKPGDIGATIRLAVTLSATDGEGRAPLAHLGRVEIAVPAAQPDWW
jgi:hypothetical protein